MSKKLNTAQSMIWNSAGSLAYLASQWLITILVVRLAGGTYTAAGILGLAMTVYNLFAQVMSYRMYTYQVSDVDKEFSYGEYMTFKLITCTAGFVIICVYAWISCTHEAFVAIALFGLYKVVYNLCNVCHAVFQIHYRLDFYAINAMLVGIVSLAVFCPVFYLTQNLEITLAGMTVAEILVAVFWALRQSVKFEKLKLGIDVKRAAGLAVTMAPAVIGAIAAGATPSLCRQYLSHVAGTDILGVFVSIAAPMAILQTGASYLYYPLLNKFGKYYNTGDTKGFARLILVVSAAIFAFGIVCIVILWFIGEPIMVLLFTESIREYTYIIVPCLVASFGMAYICFFNELLILVRDPKGSFVGNVVALAAGLVLMVPLVNSYGMNGVNATCVIAYIIGILVMIPFMVHRIKLKKREVVLEAAAQDENAKEEPGQ